MYFARHDLAILQARSLAPIGPGPDGLRLEELRADRIDAVLQTYQTLGHGHPEGRPQRRFGNGLRFGRLWLGRQLAGSLWVAHAGHRYIDEMNWRLPVNDRQFWLRDVFVAPGLRGRRLFLHMLHLVAGQWLPRFESAWSDVDWDNEASIKAHVAAGFVVAHRVRCLDIDGRLRLRSPMIPWPGPVDAILPNQRLLWLGGVRLRQHRDWVA